MSDSLRAAATTADLSRFRRKPKVYYKDAGAVFFFGSLEEYLVVVGVGLWSS